MAATKMGRIAMMVLGPVILCLPEGLVAQVPDTTQLPDSALRVSPIVVTVSRRPIRADRTGSAVSVLTEEEMRKEPPRYTFDLLRDVPGSYIDEGAGPGGPTIVRLRGGEEVFTQVLLDGVKVNQSGGFFDMQGLALSNLARVEIARGPQSAAWGSSAMSGVVHFITPEGRPGPTRLGFRGEGGGASENGGSFRGEVVASGGGERLRFSTGAGAAFNRGIFTLPHDTWTNDASLRLDYLPSDRWSLTGTFRYVRFEGHLPVRDPGASRAPLDPNARNNRDRIASAVQARFEATDSWSHELRADFYYDDASFFDERDGIDQAAFPFFVFDADIDFNERLQRPRLEYESSLSQRPGGLARELVLTYGGLWEHSDVRQEVSGDFGDSQSDFQRASGAGFAELLLDVSPRLSLLAGVRVEKFEGIDAEMTPRVSGIFSAVPDLLSLRASWGEGFKVPSLSQQFQENDFIEPNPELEPERSDSWELGADLNPPGRRWLVGITYFQQRFQNLIRTVGQEDSNRAINRNLGESEARGIEWSLRIQAHPRVAFGTTGAWVDTEILENTGLNPDEFPTGEELPFRPDLNGSIFTEIRGTERISALLRGSYLGTQTVLSERFSGERAELDSYFLVDAVLTYDHGPGVSLYGRFENLLDEEYRVAFDRPGIPFRASFGVRVSN